MLCKICGMEPQQRCVNGSVFVDEGKARECPNMKRIRLNEVVRSRLTPELFSAPKITESPLFVPASQRGAQPPVNRTKENLFIRGTTLGGLLPHLRLIFSCLPIKYKVINDSRLRDVFVGGEAFKSKPASIREHVETNNVIADLVGESYDLVVIRLGVLGHKNVAAPGILREALMIREGFNKPTWLFEDLDNSWIHSKDSYVEEYVSKRFTDVFLSNEGPQAGVRSNIVIDGPEESEAPSEVMSMAPAEEEEEPTTSGFDIDLGGIGALGGSDKKKSWKKRY